MRWFSASRPSWSPTSKAMKRIRLRAATYWPNIAIGAFALHAADTSRCSVLSLNGKSKYGGVLGVGDHAAAKAMMTFVMKSVFVNWLSVWIVRAFAIPEGCVLKGARQHALNAYTAPYTSGSVSYTHLRAHETPEHLVCRLLLEKKK